MTETIELLGRHSEAVTAAVAIAALVVSFVSILLAAWSLRAQRLHNRKSVMPIAEFVVGDYEDKLLVSLLNAGSGPLLVESFRVLSASEPRGSTLIGCMPDCPQDVDWVDFAGELPGRTLAPEQRKVLLQLEGDPQDASFVAFGNEIRRCLQGLTIEVSYRDVYGKRHPAASRPLSWFGRLLAE